MFAKNPTKLRNNQIVSGGDSVRCVPPKSCALEGSISERHKNNKREPIVLQYCPSAKLVLCVEWGAAVCSSDRSLSESTFILKLHGRKARGSFHHRTVKISIL